MMIHKKTTLRKFLEILLIIILVAYYYAPAFDFQQPVPEVEAAVAAGIIVAWPSTEASIPSGWSRVTAFDDYFLEGTTSDPSGTPGGAETHTHVDPGHQHTLGGHTHAGTTGNASGTSGTCTSGSGSAPDGHSHTITTGGCTDLNQSAVETFSAASNDPPYTEVIWIESDGTTDIPDGAWAVYNSLSLPDSWTRVNEGRFLKGAAASGDGGGDSGAINYNHGHTGSGHTHLENAHTHTGTTAGPSSQLDSLSGSGIASGSHTHAISGGSTTATEQSGTAVLADNTLGLPPFIMLPIIENTTGGSDTPADIIAMWDGTIDNIPDDWILCDGNNDTPNMNDKFLIGIMDGPPLGQTGGALTHTHTGVGHTHTINSHTHNFTVNTSSSSARNKGTGNTASGTSHTHTLSVTGGGTTGSTAVTVNDNTENRPPYKEIVYIMYKPPASTDQAHFRWRNNDGTEVDATWKAVEDSNVISDVSKESVIRLRMKSHNTGGGAESAARTYELEYGVKSTSCSAIGTWYGVGDSADAWEMVASQLVEGQSITTERLTAASSFVNGEERESADTTGSIGPLSAGAATEIEYSIQATSSATAGATYCFRLYDATANAELDHYSNYPEATIESVSNLTWNTGSADFEIYESSELTWDAGSLICSATLTDDNGSTVDCDSDSLAASTQYRVQVILKNTGDAAANMASGDYLDHKNVKAGWGGTSPTLDTCGFSDIGLDNGSTTCSIAWNSNDVRITNTGGGNVVLGATTGTEGFMYLITTDSDAATSATSYMDASIDSITEDSSKITIDVGGGYASSGTYTSSNYDTGGLSAFNIISWTESVTENGSCGESCEIKVQIKTAPDDGGSPGTWSSTWCGPEGEDADETDFFTDPSGELIHTDHNNDKWIKYLVTFSGDGVDTPILHEIQINYQ